MRSVIKQNRIVSAVFFVEAAWSAAFWRLVLWEVEYGRLLWAVLHGSGT